jgi:hypothetical protein
MKILRQAALQTVAGTFNNWSSAYNLTDIGYGIWETTVDLNPNSYYEFKFGK